MDLQPTRQVVRPRTGDTVVTVKIIRPIPMAEMLLALNVVSVAWSTPTAGV